MAHVCYSAPWPGHTVPPPICLLATLLLLATSPLVTPTRLLAKTAVLITTPSIAGFHAPDVLGPQKSRIKHALWCWETHALNRWLSIG